MKAASGFAGLRVEIAARWMIYFQDYLQHGYNIECDIPSGGDKAPSSQKYNPKHKHYQRCFLWNSNDASMDIRTLVVSATPELESLRLE